ncbi:hypothetical protein BCD64_23295 [Nostoc sp. MBR 210]|nr:hypothetical protein BCD64_23295 [Nostoc sp. MBR 210]
MAEPTLQQVFGANATQDATTLTIAKADLAAVGLNALASNTAESLWVAVLLQASEYLTPENLELNAEQQVAIEESTVQTLVTRNNSSYRQVSFTVDLQTPDINFQLDPDSF